MSLSKNQFKLITSLQLKKYRNLHNLFIAEGKKVVDEFLQSDYELQDLFCIDSKGYEEIENITIVSASELKKISSLKTPNNVLGIFKIPEKKEFSKEGITLVLDEINDPGNLGTIIRLCDWFGIKQIICSKNTVDCYNQKVVQSTMGSLTRVFLFYTNLETYLKQVKVPIYATVLEGKSIYTEKLPQNAVIIMGNEANGISNSILKLATNTISIPRFGNLQQTESLNVATATAIILNEFRRGSL